MRPSHGNKQRNTGQDPWRSGQQEGLPDLLYLLKKFFGKLTGKPVQKSEYPSLAPGKMIGLGVVILLALWALSGIFLVRPAEQSVVLRFGKYAGTVGPGLHWVPAIVEQHYTANIQRVESFPYEAEMLTQDGNIVSVKIQVQYRISDLKDYFFHVVNPIVTLHQAASSALRQVVGRMNLDPILTTGREALAEQVGDFLRQTLAGYHSGIEIREVTLQSSRPPEAVTAAFDDVIKATEDEKRYINQAEAYAKKRVLIAQGGAARIAQEADAYRYSVVAEATGATARYMALLRPYQEAPNITRERLYLETVSTVLKNTNNILVEGSGNNVLYLPLEQWLARQTAQAPSQEKTAAATTSAPSSSEVEKISGSSDQNNMAERPSYPAEEDNR